ncbi:hypothetical protein BDU57DRAFT_144615 [Ampelomyces quisqualis]|uniref:Small secreted protein n=1 Tax=Ampelomyces quisqualis TaxID=50730 RepID=A0A6A5QVY2_AMPQU|nr:hypothetical protein BDU57DRAFT_144615 [Ampelomyces quisqualis]
MHFQCFTILSLAALSVALPASLKTRQAGVFQATTFNDISIAGGQAGNAEAEATAALSGLDLNDLANVSQADLDFLNEVNQVANDAEKEAFNPAVEAATGAAADAAQNGKIKNKVLKLMATVIKLQAQEAQGQDVAAKLAEETTKLNNNIATDEANAGQESTAVPFEGAISA